MRIETTKCRQFGHREFVLEADEVHVPSTYLTDVIEIIEGMVATGSKFEHGQTFQIGWGLTLVQKCGEMLSLAEPDMESFPIKWSDGITITLRQMMLQLFMLDSFSMRQEMDVPSIQHSVVACTRYDEPSFFMSRSQGDGGSDSGWFVGCLNDDHDHQEADNLTCVSLYEAFLSQKAIQSFVSFPVDSIIEVDQMNGLKVLKGGSELVVAPGSFLDEWFKRDNP